MSALSCDVGESAPSVCLRPLWTENPHRLMTLWDMFTFDGGKLARAMQFLAESGKMLEQAGYSDCLVRDLPTRAFHMQTVAEIAEYCDDVPFPMTKITLERILLSQNDRASLTVSMLIDLLEEAKRRLRDEAGIYPLFRLSPESAPYYRNPTAGWEKIVARFPDAVSDIEEMRVCFALSRHPACVFHSTQVIEHGLIEFGKFLNVKDPKSGWTAVANELGRIVKTEYAKRTDFERIHYGFIEQMQGSVEALKNAWRNKIGHAQGRLVILRPEFSPQVAEEIMAATRACMRNLAVDLPPADLVVGLPLKQ